MHSFFQDVRYALRSLRKSPGYALVAILALAIGIGSNATIFVTVNAMLLRPLPFRDLDRIVFAWTTVPARGASRVSMTPANFAALRKQTTDFDALAARHGWDANLTGNGLPERLEGVQVTGDFFRVLGMKPMLGRSINEGDQQPGNIRVVVLSYAVWKNRFASDASIVGKTVTLNGQSMTVAGVMPSEFDFPLGTEIWAPLALTPAEQADRANGYLTVIGRLKPGVSIHDAQAQMDTIAARLARDFPDTNTGHGVHLVTVVADMNNSTRDFLVILMAAAGFVLLLACANIANLQLARAISRQKEFALRTALGARRGRLLRQMLVESELVALLGGMLGLFLTSWSMAAIRTTLPPFIVEHIPGLTHLNIDRWVLAFTAGIAVLSGFVSGILPALHGAWRTRLHDVLKEGGRGSTADRSGHRLRAVLVVSEVTLALVLLIGSGMLVEAFRNLARINYGFDTAHLLTFQLKLPDATYPKPEQRAAAFDAISTKLSALPGVQGVSPISSVPSGWSWNGSYLVIEGEPPAAPGQEHITYTQTVGPDFLRVMRAPLLRGRFFSASDGRDSQPVVVVSEELAKHYWPAGDAIGHRIRLGKESSEPWRTIVGVVGDIRMSSFDTLANNFAYTPESQTPGRASAFVVRTSGDPLAVAASVRQQVAAFDPTLPIYDIRTEEQVIGDNISGVQFSARMMIAFGIISLLLAGAGIYAVMSYSVAQRTHEIGVRMALGARPSDVLSMIVGYTVRLVAIGIALGLPLAFAVSRLMSGTVMGVLRPNVASFVVFPAVLSAVALLAGLVPARWATKVDPMEALRCE
ncbi:MAG: ABC transporter permease [Terriglobales bacterium]